MTDDSALLESNIDEEFEDLEDINDWSEGAVLWSTDWTAETLLSQLDRGNINLEPNFQRRMAWRDDKQSRFIESLVLGLPIPQLIFAEDKNRKGSFIVIDGKQRLLSIRRFAIENDDSDFEPLKLARLKERKDLNGLKYSNLLDEPSFADDLAAFQNASIRTIVIRNWKNEAYLYEVFLRINTGSVQLSPQELRQALHPGPFSTFIDTASADSYELKTALKLKQPDFRMRDAEILLRYIAYKNFHGEYAGNLKQFLDNATKDINSNWSAWEGKIRSQVNEMEEAFKFTRELFGEKKYLRKWNGHNFESRKNRAVFDIMLYFFSDRNIRTALEKKGELLVSRYKKLCENNTEFLSSIESTTKSIDANNCRFNEWAKVIEEVGKIKVAKLNFGL